MIEFTDRTPTIAQVYNYTYSNKYIRNRFKYEKRDILISKIKIEKHIVYRKNKEGKFTAPDERLMIHSESAPQYYPYFKIKSKEAKKQMKIKHQYDCIFCIQKTDEGVYDFWKSKIIWHVGSFKKYPNKIPQSKVATIHGDTRLKLEKKYANLSNKERKEKIKDEIKKIKSKAKYLCDGDYVSRELGINGDFYFRASPLLLKNDALYGKCWYNKLDSHIKFCFFDKHSIGVLYVLLHKKIIKYK